MWTIYDIHTDRYWNEKLHCWCAVHEATLYTFEERDSHPLRDLSTQWRYIAPGFRGQPNYVMAGVRA